MNSITYNVRAFLRILLHYC